MPRNSTYQALPAMEMEPFLADADYLDVTTAIGGADLRTFLANWFNYQPAWLMRVQRLVGIGSKTKGPVSRLSPEMVPFQEGARLGPLTVRLAEQERYWLAEIHIKQLNASLGFVAEPLANRRTRFSVFTAVHYTSLTGPLYFQFIRPFHRLLISGKTSAGVR
ncbi:DUF2867 domain-containing protein [Ktedonosporobacter rubrisoli]|nr:DUF2867 domain-containing protein [Ktedonosporobacter rubrisoli]